MAILEVMLSSKGGIGKTVCSVIYHEWLLSRGVNAYGIDCEPNNKKVSYSCFSGDPQEGGLPVAVLDIHGVDNDVSTSKLDALPDIIEGFGLGPEDRIIIDCGASGYPSLQKYLKIGGYRKLTGEDGHMVRVHVVIPGGSDTAESLECFTELADDSLPQAPFVVWLNPYQGDVILEEGGHRKNRAGETEAITRRRPFLNSDFYKAYQSRIAAVVEMSIRSQDKFYKDALKDLLSKNLTFAAGQKSPKIGVVFQDRVAMFWRDMEKALDGTGLAGPGGRQ